jgi:nicotinamide-nucleotide amidase
MRAEILTIGDEILIGQIINTNAAWIAQQLNLIGIKVIQHTSTSDDRNAIITSLKAAEGRADFIFITGGLGPTKDDITKHTLCDYFNCSLVFHEPTYQHIQSLFHKRGLTITELNKKQAEICSICIPIFNSQGTAPGMWFESNGKIFVSMPGVPYEMKAIMSEGVIPQILKQFKLTDIVHKTILTQDIGESWLDDKIKAVENNLPKHIKLAYLPSPGIVRLRLSAYGGKKEELEKEIEEQVSLIQELVPQYIYGYDEDTLEQIVGRLLIDKKQTLSTAESCTGGYIAHRIISVPGSSAYYVGSIISYANEVKINELGIKENDIQEFGAVSEEVVYQMAKRAKEKMRTDYVIATTGIAGPSGGTEEKPVGTVWVAIASPSAIITKKLRLSENRERNIHMTAIYALNMLRKEIVRVTS